MQEQHVEQKQQELETRQAQAGPQAKATPGQKGKATREWALLIGFFVWGYLFVANPPMIYLGIGLACLGLAVTAIAYGYLRASGVKPSKASYLYLGFFVLLSLSFAFFENSLLCGGLFLLLFPAYAFWLSQAARARTLSPRDALETLGLLMLRPFQKLGEKFGTLALGSKGSKHTRNVLIGLAVTLPVLAIATNLLMEADSAFENILMGFGNSFFESFGTVAFRAVAAAVIGGYLFSMLLGALRTKDPDKEWRLPQISPTIMGIMVSALCILYVAFLGVQLTHLPQALATRNPDASFYSEYARDGFFQLCLVALLNLAVFLVAHACRREQGKPLCVLLTALGGLTQLIIVTALIKMGLYMGAYGLTLLRVHTTWFMALLFLAFGVLMALQWKRFSGIKWIGALCATVVLLAAYANIGGLVARVNVNRYLQGTLARFDMQQYYSFPGEAIPEIIRLYQATDHETVLKDAEEFLSSCDIYESPYPLEQSVQEMMAREQLRQLRESTRTQFLQSWQDGTANPRMD